ncbi:MAG: F0F1 ATP synthase subunit gamma [Bifidobacteriaceae bacterium]|jgi:F-type H+-transporting ATPase subunit gamma|nr:F0F1 ATP synthase subunit gamma [Bifidobacteriaceae bacterium]
MPSQLVLKKRIASTQSLEKIFRAQELISASRITKARQYAQNAMPYADAITKAVRAVSNHASVEHILTNHKRKAKATALLVIASDRGMSGNYTSSIIRQANAQIDKLKADGKNVLLYVSGKRAVSYYNFRNIKLENFWTGNSDAPAPERSQEIAKALVDCFLKTSKNGGVDEVIIVCSEFVNMVLQRPRVIRMLPLQVVDEENADISDSEELGASLSKVAKVKNDVGQEAKKQGVPLYEFEPSPDAVLDAILPRYVSSRIQECMLEAAASETASRQTAMHTAGENANDLVEDLTRKANQARQASITNELSEIVAGAAALQG